MIASLPFTVRTAYSTFTSKILRKRYIIYHEKAFIPTITSYYIIIIQFVLNVRSVLL